MADDEEEDLKKLSPKERIKKLKEIQEKRKEEIEEAQKLLKQAQEESDIEDQLKEIPIPQVTAVDIDELFSPEEKELFRAIRFVDIKKKEETVEEKVQKKEEGLESIAEEAPRMTAEEAAHREDYVSQLSMAPTEKLYSRAKEIYSQFKEQGYLTSEQQKEFTNIEYANKQKMEDIQTGKYTEASKVVAQEMILIEKMKSSVGLYRR